MISACSSESLQGAPRPKKVASKAKRRMTHLGMVKAAIRALKEPAGSTAMSICKYIGNKLETPIEADKVTHIVKKALREGMEKSALVKPPTATNRYKIKMCAERRRRRRKGGKKGKGKKKGRGRRRRRRGRKGKGKGKGKGKKGKGRRRRRRGRGKKGKK